MSLPTGLTEGAGWEIGVSRTIPYRVDDVWAMLTAPHGLARWLGPLDELPTVPGTAYRTAEGTTGELRSRHERERLRLTWRPPGGEESTVQVTVSPEGEGRTRLRFHQERLRNAEERERQRAHWKRVLDRIEDALRATPRAAGGPTPS
jgi:uncharacterized protein YndB with AHSA1/START domain